MGALKLIILCIIRTPEPTPSHTAGRYFVCYDSLGSFASQSSARRTLSPISAVNVRELTRAYRIVSRLDVFLL